MKTGPCISAVVALLCSIQPTTNAITGGACPESGQGLQDGLSACLPDSEEAELVDFFDMHAWEKLCRRRAAIKSCVESDYATCGQEFKDKAYGSLIEELSQSSEQWLPSADALGTMAESGCSEADVDKQIKDLYMRGDNMNCMTRVDQEDLIAECMGDWLQEMTYYRLDRALQLTDPERWASLNRFAMSAFQCARNLVLADCSPWAQNLLLYVINMTLPDEMKPVFTREQVNILLNQASMFSTMRSTIGVYGDHLLVYNVSRPITCVLPDQVTYLSNQLFRIYGTNLGGAKPSEQSEIVIDFFRNGGGVLGSYVASSKLSSQFQIGLTKLSPYHNPIEIVALIEGVKVQINSTSRAYVIQIEKRGWRLLFTVRISDGVLKTSSGYLVSGCSYHRQEVVNTYLGENSTEECRSECQNVDTDVAFNLTQTCLYDCQKFGGSETVRHFSQQLDDSVQYDEGLSLIAPPPTPESLSSAAQAQLRFVTSSVLVIVNYYVISNFI